MSDSMIERVRDAIYDAASGPECSGISEALAEKFARTAIAAMRKPTVSMIKASQALWTFEGRYHSDAPAEEQWPAMIDAALEEDRTHAESPTPSKRRP